MIRYLKTAIKMLLPYVIVARHERRKYEREQAESRERQAATLFDGHDALFKAKLGAAKIYGEYGCGQSTLWVLNHTDCPIYSVDSAAEWIVYVRTEGKNNPRLHMIAADLGPVGKWGRPLSYEKRENIPDYLFGPWRQEEKPDVVLIDGRFRVACFLASLLEAGPGTVILFDDYLGDEYNKRGQYRIVEELLPPEEFCGRQACFIVPDKIDKDKVRALLDKFIYVMD